MLVRHKESCATSEEGAIEINLQFVLAGLLLTVIVGLLVGAGVRLWLIGPLKKRLECNDLALDSSRTGTFDVDVLGKVIKWSKHHELMFGLAEGEFDGTSAMFRRFLHPDDHAWVAQRLRESRERGEAYEFECRIIRRDGVMRWIQARGQPFLKDGVCYRVIGTVIDVTERKHDENELRLARDRADAANRVKSTFIANMSHEVRTPLSIVIGYAEMLTHEAQDSLNVPAIAAKIESNGRHLLGLLDDVLDLAKIEAERLTMERVKLDLRSLLSELAQSFTNNVAAKGLMLAVHMPISAPSLIMIDPLRLRQILYNMISNAIKFTAKGVINIAVQFERGALSIHVQDTGRGVPDALRNEIFEPFVQADDGIDRQFAGLGLGLTLSRRLAVAMGGRLELIKNGPSGSTFALFLPKDATVMFPDNTAQDLEKLNVRQRAKELAGLNILLVEDHPDNRYLVSQMLTGAGARVDMAVDGQEGYEKVMSAIDPAYDVILMDIQMPIMDGYETTRRLRRNGCAAPIVALSAHAMKEEQALSIAMGCNAHLTKPALRQDLVRTILDSAGKFGASPMM